MNHGARVWSLVAVAVLAVLGLASSTPTTAAMSMGEVGAELLPADANFYPQRSGSWSNPTTWQQGRVPASDGGNPVHVFIPHGFTVTVMRQMDDPSQAVDTLRLEGTLAFATDRSTRLVVDTLVSLDGGRLLIGPTPNEHLPEEHLAEIVIAARCPASGSCFGAGDTEHLGHGLILNGPVDINGAPKASFAAVAGGYGPGSEALLLQGKPAGWDAGDEIVLAPARFARAYEDAGAQQAERFRIRELVQQPDGLWSLGLGKTTDSSPASLRYDHTPYSGLSVHVANLTRNIVIRSQQADLDRRGHVLITTADAHLRHVALRDLGRTDKKIWADNPRLDSGVPAIEHNKRGRYPLHFHRVAMDGMTALVKGAVVDTSPGWGFVNHSSSVNFDNCVSFSVDGAGFVAEAGNETGRFAGNIAIQGYGDPDFGRYLSPRFEDDPPDGPPDKGFGDGRNANGDMGFTGDGFWIQSPAVAVTDNVAAGFQGRGFGFWNLGLYEPSPDGGSFAGINPEIIPTVWTDKPDGSYRTYVQSGQALPSDFQAHLFDRNTAYASFIGFMVRFNNSRNTKVLVDENGVKPPYTGQATAYYLPTTFSNLTAWNNELGFSLSYIISLRLENAGVFTNDDAGTPTGFAIEATNSMNDAPNGTDPDLTVFNQLEIRGYEHAIDLGADASVPRFCVYGPRFGLTDTGTAIRWDGGWLPTPLGTLCKP